MSLKNRDEHNRWRNKTVAFRVSPEEWEQIERYVQLSGLTKQDYITRRLINKEVVVQGNPRVYKALRNNLANVLIEILPELSWMDFIEFSLFLKSNGIEHLEQSALQNILEGSVNTTKRLSIKDL